MPADNLDLISSLGTKQSMASYNSLVITHKSVCFHAHL